VIEGANPGATAILTVLKSGDLNEVNSINEPTKIKPVDQQVNLTGKTISLSLAPYSVNVIRIKMR
jgi:alpha-L-arabinofuranosidase